MVEVTLASIWLPLVGALIYAGVFALKNMQSGQAPDGVKFIATLITGAIIGVISIATGIVPTQIDIEAQLVAFAGITAVAETIIKLIVRAVYPQPSLFNRK